MYAKVIAVGGENDQQIGYIRAEWPDVGEYPDWIAPLPSSVLAMPAPGDFVEVVERRSDPGRYEWRGVQSRAERMPAEVVAAHPDVVAVLPPHRRCYIVLDDRAGADGAIRLIAGSAYITIKNDATVVELEGVEIKLGSAATERAVLGDALKTLYDAHTHPTGVGPSGPPVAPMVVGTHLSTKVKVE